MFQSITLEVSLKPFKQTCEAFIRKTCQGIFKQWKPLLKGRQEISIMLWVGDGSELLDYDGDLEKEFEWAYFIGTANLPLIAPDDDPAISLHSKKRLYIENPPKMTYAILKNIIRIFKDEGKNYYPNAKITVGETFDIGPEFALSDFKYNRHTEILGTRKFYGKYGIIDSTLTLNADTRKYAAYPNGIPQDTPFATFLGAQTKAFFKDMGFDYIWLSNGLGFSANPWDETGKIFDGKEFYPEKLKDTARKVFGFWKNFQKACPDIPIHTRGTNNSVGIDYATDGVPLHDIYSAKLNLMPPPNSPWAALNGNYGLEIMGHMTRICEIPDNDFLFRYYIHDPWWMNSPWYDRYSGHAGDIYLPASISRVTKEGKVQSATRFHILSIDNSKGDMPDSCVNEPLPHILKAEKDCADDLPFLVWLYPMREFTTAQGKERLREMYYGDNFICNAINRGLPLNCVVSADIFKSHALELYKGRVLVSPVVEEQATIEKLQAFVEQGGNLIVYGSKQALQDFPIIGENVAKIDIAQNSSIMRKTLAKFGYDIQFPNKADDDKRLCIWNTTRANNGLFFSVLNMDTTKQPQMQFPLGAPILIGGETELINGAARYHFSRCEHRECRVFVEQKSGVISAFEEPPVSAKYRRRFAVEGLEDATVYYFPERYCQKQAAITKSYPDDTPVLEGGWQPFYHDVFGWGFKAEHQQGKLAFLMPFPEVKA